MKKHLLPALLALFLFHTPAVADEAAPVDKLQARQALVSRMKDGTLAVLQDAKKPLDERAQTMAQGFSKMLDIEWIAKFVAGNAWRSASDAERARYTELYHTFLIDSYVKTFSQNRDRKITDIKILGLADAGEDSFTAKTELMLSDDERLKIDYRVKETPGHNKIVDIIIENVSMLATHRAEFSQIASREGLSGIIHTLEQKLRSEPIVLSMNNAQ